MKTTEYFKHVRNRPYRSRILEAWIERAIREPVAERTQVDGRVRRWVYIPEEERYLRVVLRRIAKPFTMHSLTAGSNHESQILSRHRYGAP